MIGINENKPFECVGTRNEAVSALGKYIENNSSYLTDKYKNYILENARDLENLLKEYNSSNNLPKELADILIENL